MIKIYTRAGTYEVPSTLIGIISRILSNPSVHQELRLTNEYVDFAKIVQDTQNAEVEMVDVIDETQATPVLEDVPEDPEITIENLNTRILILEAELEERKRATDRVLEALRPLGTIVKEFTSYQTYLEPEAPVAGDTSVAGAGGTTVLNFDPNKSAYTLGRIAGDTGRKY
jgi:hypothetical protein